MKGELGDECHLYIQKIIIQNYFLELLDCIARNRTWLYRLLQSQIIMYSLFIGRTATVWKIRNISSSAPGLSVMTLRECRVDCPFPVT
jgi:hypothetical protein